MTESDHPDEIERLRASLWGDERVERHAATCGSCAADVAYHRRLRDTFRRWADAAPLPSASASASEAAHGAADVGPGRGRWFLATPVAHFGGVRSAGSSDLHVVCDAGDLHVDVLLHRLPKAGRCSLSGQVLRADAAPLARVPVTLFVDGRREVATESDDFGEFAFSGVRGARFGLGIGTGAQAAHVSIPPHGETA